MRRQMTFLALASAAALAASRQINNQVHEKLNEIAERPMNYNSPIFSPLRSARIKNKRRNKRK